ncbi:BON domain-containing protein [Thiotrichales bacterium 19S3-7]|nr:BON domain-containing protein [Thiotrichales bacterium 19S3-7]MCF6802989.1 BON domain-containing protein [Thiotrichales bacterium 19S3-11]
MNISSKFKLMILSFAVSSISLVAISGCAPVVVAGASGAAVGGAAAGNSIPVKTQVSDMQIKMNAIELLKDYPALKNNSNVEIIVFDQIVLLLGQVPNESIKTSLANKIANLKGVRIVYDQLTVGSPVSVGTYASDSLITTSVISSLIANGINSLKYKVVTEQGIVYMMGAVTKSEAKNASTVASQVSGVQKVIEAYSIIPSNNKGDENNDQSMKQTSAADETNDLPSKEYQSTSQGQANTAIGPSGPV